MKLQIIAVGNKMPGWIKTGFEEYAKRMPKDVRIELSEIKPESRTTGKTAEQMMAAEAQRIQAALPASSLPVILDEHGKQATTLQLAEKMTHWMHSGQDVALIIGGADGLHPNIKQQARDTLALSKLTLPHPMVRVLLAEQLYRAWSLINNHPYHRA